MNITINVHRIPHNKAHLQKFQEKYTFTNTRIFSFAFFFNLGFKCCHRISLTKTLLVIAEREMSDFFKSDAGASKALLATSPQKNDSSF